MSESIRQLFARWRLEQLLVKYSGLRLVPAADDSVKLAGVLAIDADSPGKGRIVDEYQIEISIPKCFPRQLPAVRETGGRIPRSFHKLHDGTLCLGSPTQLLMVLEKSLSIVRFVERCVIPYFYGYSYFKNHGTLPFGELDHGAQGLRQDLMTLFRVDREDAVFQFVRLTSMKKRHANKNLCPCGSGRRLGRCHHRRVNLLRDRVGRYWFRVIQQSLRQDGIERQSRTLIHVA